MNFCQLNEGYQLNSEMFRYHSLNYVMKEREDDVKSKTTEINTSIKLYLRQNLKITLKVVFPDSTIRGAEGRGKLE